jgi:hypothetical protein
MKTIERDVHESRNLVSADKWNRWKQWKEVREEAPGSLQLLLKDPNPEVTLSVLDLCMMSSFLLDNEWLSAAKNAKSRLIDCLVEYFDWKHYENSKYPKRRAYLQTELERLRSGDVVITLNWDTTVERTLLELGRWSPRDGYGFLKELRYGDSDPSDPLPEKLSRPSDIVVLKLHGSVGWYRHQHTAAVELYYKGDFLQHFFPEAKQWVYDPVERLVCDQRKFRDSNDSIVIAYPSFIKELSTPPIPEIWRRADCALRCAHEVEIWGYSLPKSDSAVRALLNPLRSRLEEEQLQVSVHEPYDNEVCVRWRQSLGPKAQIDKRRLGGKSLDS